DVEAGPGCAPVVGGDFRGLMGGQVPAVAVREPLRRPGAGPVRAAVLDAAVGVEQAPADESDRRVAAVRRELQGLDPAGQGDDVGVEQDDVVLRLAHPLVDRDRESAALLLEQHAYTTPL